MQPDVAGTEHVAAWTAVVATVFVVPPEECARAAAMKDAVGRAVGVARVSRRAMNRPDPGIAALRGYR